MEATEIQELLNQLWASSLIELKWDLENHQIKLKLEALDNNGKHENEVIFADLYGLAYFEEEKLDDSNEAKWNYAEISELYHTPNNRDRIRISVYNQENKFSNEKFFSTDFHLIIWNHSLLIRARRIIVNGIEVIARKKTKDVYERVSYDKPSSEL